MKCLYGTVPAPGLPAQSGRFLPPFSLSFVHPSRVRVSEGGRKGEEGRKRGKGIVFSWGQGGRGLGCYGTGVAPYRKTGNRKQVL